MFGVCCDWAVAGCNGKGGNFYVEHKKISLEKKTNLKPFSKHLSCELHCGTVSKMHV